MANVPFLNADGQIELNTDVLLTGDLSISGDTTISGQTAYRVLGEVGTDATYALTAAESGKVFVATRTSATQTYTLPAAATGLSYTFVNGHASGEINIDSQTSEPIVGKTHGAENAVGIATSGGTGIKNTAATDVIGDFCTLTAVGTSWYMTAVAGVWAAQ